MKNHCSRRSWFRLFLLLILVCFTFSPASSLAQGTPFAVPGVKAQTNAPWLDAQESGGIVYLLYASPPIIKRYQMSSETWFPDITLSGTPTSFRVSSDALYVGFGRRVARLQLDGTGETHLMNTAWDIIALHVDDPILIINCSTSTYAHILTFNLSSLTLVDNKTYYPESMVGTSLAPGINKLFGRTSGISPADIVQATYTPEGMVTSEMDSPYHGDYAGASKTWVSPDEQLVFDDSGTVYNTKDLTLHSSLGGGLTDLTFYGDLPIVLRGGTLIAYSNMFLETGRKTPANAPFDIFICGDTIYGFYNNADGPQVSQTSISELSPLTPGTPVDPNGLTYTPDLIQIGSDETVYLLSKTNKSIFRWSLAQRSYLSTIPLLDQPYTFAYAGNENRLYTVYSNGSIYKIELDGDLLETPFANLPSSPCGLATAGSFVFTCDNSGAWVTHTTFAPTGQKLSTEDWNYYSREYIWNAARQKMYFFRDDTSPNDLLWEDINAYGTIGSKKDSPYHGDFAFVHPIRVKTDGSVVLIGTGLIFDGLSLSQVNTLSNGFSDADWKGDSLVTIRSFNGGSELQKWTPGNYGIARTKSIKGSPLRLFSVNEGWLAITSLSGRPRFTLWSTEFDSLSNPPMADFSATPLIGDAPLEVHFTNLSTEGPIDTSTWDFGDGETSTDENPVHPYTKSGSYTVKLTVSGPGGADTMTKSLVIQVRPVTASFTASTTRGSVPLSVQFNNQSTGQYTSVLWDFGDETTSTERSPLHLYERPGTYTVKLTVDGPYGTSTAVRTNLIQVLPVTANFTASITKGMVPLVVQFTDQSIGQFDCSLWDFGDGTTSTEKSPVHTYQKPGTYTVTLTVDGPYGSNTVIKKDLIQVLPVNPNFAASVTSGRVPLTVQFTNQTTGAFDSSLWDFGDGTTSTDKNPQHIYEKPGIYTVVLTVDGTYGKYTVTKANLIQVLPVSADFSASVTTGRAPLEVQFTNKSLGQFNSTLWDFGDGSTSAETNPLHIYRKKGSYTVSLTIDGPYGSDTLTKTNLVTVNNVNHVYIPSIAYTMTGPFLKPGHYAFDNLCQQFPLYRNSAYVGQMKECVPSVDILTDGTMYFYLSWTYYQSASSSQCVAKGSNAVNHNLYIKDSSGKRYDHTKVGGSDAIDCMESGVTYTGWFKFPAAQASNTAFTFYDDDAGIKISPIILSAAK